MERHAEPKVSKRSPTPGHLANVPMAGTPCVTKLREPKATDREEPEGTRPRRECGRRRTPVHTLHGRVTEVAQTGVRMEVVGEERAEARSARHLQLAQFECTVRSPCAR